MSLELEGTVIEVLPQQSGTSGSGKAWKKGSFVIEVPDEKYPKKVMFDSMQEKTVEIIGKLKTGTKVKVQFNIESKEFNGRYFTNASAWRIDNLSAGSTTGGTSKGSSVSQPQVAGSSHTEDAGDDLPF